MYDPLKQWDLPQWVPSYGVILPTFDAPKIDTRLCMDYTIDSL